MRIFKIANSNFGANLCFGWSQTVLNLLWVWQRLDRNDFFCRFDFFFFWFFLMTLTLIWFPFECFSFGRCLNLILVYGCMSEITVPLMQTFSETFQICCCCGTVLFASITLNVPHPKILMSQFSTSFDFFLSLFTINEQENALEGVQC